MSALLARAIVLQLLGGEPVWRGDAAVNTEDVVGLAEEAVAAATSSGDVALRANAYYAQAFVLTGYRGLQEGVDSYRTALELAKEVADPLAEFAILVNLGHQLASIDLAEGRSVLEEARAILTSGALDEQLGARGCELETARVEYRIGIAAFDLGDYGEALDLLVSSADTLRGAHRRLDHTWALAFLGQVYTAIGLFEAARAVLEEAIALYPDRPGPVGVRGYLHALLGHVDVEWDPPRLAAGRQELEVARSEVADSGYRAVAPLVDTLFAELLLAERTPSSLREATNC